jgi:hypothetical protein
MNRQFISHRLVFIFCMLLFSLVSLQLKCKKDDQQKRLLLPKHKKDELLVWRKPGVTEEAWNAKKTALKGTYGGDISVTKKCDGCDQALEVWGGTTIQNFINEEVASSATRPRGKPTGEDGVWYYSLNFIADLPIEKQLPTQQFSATPLPSQAGSNSPVIIVAVFDTGADPQITTNNSQPVSSCKPGTTKGWNFVNESNDVTDDHPGNHGTVVSKFILDEVNSYAVRNPANILPVKIFGTDGSADLFSILCGFSYAQKAGAKIINASFGFYYYLDEPPAILLKYVEKVLTANNIIMVAAAGNRLPDEDVQARDILGIAEADLRNLEKHYFYPGGLSKYLSNVICVTTVSNTLGTSATNQNYSPVIVDVGTAAGVAGSFEFIHPFLPPQTVIGSSFATPVFTGELCAFYSRAVTLPVNKDTIITNMKTLTAVFADIPPLAGRVKLGRYVKR